MDLYERKQSGLAIEHFYHGRGLVLLLAVAIGSYMLKVPSWERLPPKYFAVDNESYKYLNICNPPLKINW